MIHQGSKRYPVTEVCLHTSATPGAWQEGKSADQMRDEIRHWHMSPGGGRKPWRDIGYHRVFGPAGDMALGRSIYEIGAGVAGRNRGVIHICLIPVNTVLSMGEFDDFYTPGQRKALKAYLSELRTLAGTDLKISGHNEYSNKLCPGFKVKDSDWA